MGSSKLRSAVGKLSVPEVSSGLRNMFTSDRAFKKASEMEGLLTGRDKVSLMTGPQSALLSGPSELVIPPLFGRTRQIEGPPGPPDYKKKPVQTIISDGMGGGKRTRRKRMVAKAAQKKKRAGARKQRSRRKRRSYRSSSMRNRKR